MTDKLLESSITLVNKKLLEIRVQYNLLGVSEATALDLAGWQEILDNCDSLKSSVGDIITTILNPNR